MLQLLKKATDLRHLARRLALAAIVLIAPAVSWGQETLTVHDGTTTNNYVPAYIFYYDDFTRSQFVVPAEELAEMSGGTINAIKFYTNTDNIPYTTASTVDVYLMEVGYTTMTALEPKANGTIVYQGYLNVVSEGSGGSLTITLSTPYTYGGGNLLVGIENTTDAGYKNIKFYGETVTGASLSGYNSSSLTNVTGSQRNFIPKTTFTYEAASTGCDMPTSIAVDDITVEDAVVTWGGDAPAYNLRYKASTDEDYTLVEGVTSPYTLEGLDQNTAYSVGVQTDCGDNTSNFKSTNFTTANPCAAPTDLQVTDITPTDATLSWTAGYQEESWTVKYKTAAETEWTEETVDGAPSFDLSDLMPNTTYSVQVLNCTEDGAPYLSGSFSTLAGIPLTEAFATTSAPTGWTRYTGLLSSIMDGSATLSTTTSGWNFYTGNGVFDNHAKINIYGTSCKYWLVTPELTMEDNVQLMFDLALTAYSGTLAAPATSGTDDKFVVLITTDGGSTWEILRQWDNAGSDDVLNDIANSATGEPVAINLSDYAGQSIKIAFYGESTASNADNNLHIDNVSINYIPSCAVPTGLAKSNVTAHTVDLSWTSEAEGFVVAYKASTDDDFTEEEVAENPYTLTGLNPETTYSVKVRAICGGVYSDWGNAISFTTGIACPAPTAVTVTPSGRSAEVAWTENGSASEWEVAYRLASGTDDDYAATTTTVTDNPYSLTGLTPESAYIVRVRAVCGGIDGESQWATKNFSTLVACPAPSNLAAALTPGDGSVATLSWTSDAADFVLQYGSDNTFADDSYIEVEVNANSEDLTGLTAEQTYYARVKAVCGSEDGESAWSSVCSFTPTDAYSLTVNDGTNTHSYVPFYGYYADANTNSQFIIPAADLAAMQWGTIQKLTFYGSNASVAWNGAVFDVYFSEVSNTEFASAALDDWSTMTLAYTGSVSVSDNKMELTLTTPYQYMGGNLMIGFNETTNSSNYPSMTWYGVTQETNAAVYQYSSYSATLTTFLPKTTFDYVPGEEPTCAKPTQVAVSYTGGTTATVSWTSDATAWNLKVNGTPVTGTITNPYTLTGLQLATTYSIEVQADCGSSNGVSEWTTPVSFTTDLCLPEDMCELTFELTDAWGDSWNGNAIRVTDVLTDAVLGELTNENLNGTTGSGENELNIKTLAVCDGREIQFSWVIGNYDGEASYVVTDINEEVIFSGTGAMSEPVNYTVSCTVSDCRMPSDLAAANVTAHTAQLSWTENGVGEEPATEWVLAYKTAEDEEFTEENVNNNGGYVLADLAQNTTYTWKVRTNGCDDKWSIAATFSTLAGNNAPTNLAVSNLASTTATISWTRAASNDLHESYDLYYSKLSSMPETLNEDSLFTGITATTHDFSNLESVVTYYVWVRDNCGDDGESDWTSTSFTTLPSCPTPTALAATNITNNAATISWTGSTDVESYTVQYRVASPGMSTDGLVEDFEDGTMPAGWTIEGPGSWTVGTGDYSASTGAHSGTYNAKINHDTDGNETYLVTPNLDLSSQSDLTVNMWYINRSWTGDIDGFGVYYRVNNGEWNEIFATTDASSAWTEINEALPSGAYAANCQFGFKMTDYYGYGVAIDDITIGNPQPIPAGEWQDATTNVVEESFTIEGLEAETKYDVQVKSNCTNGVYSAPYTFTTASVFTKSIQANKWYAIATPAHDCVKTNNAVAVANVFNLTAAANDLYSYDEANGNWMAESDSLMRGTGYIYRSAEDAELGFVGYANTGSVSVSLTSSCSDNDLKGFNLIGNPYPHAVAFSQPHYTLNPNGTWTAHNNGTIGIAEAFLVYSAYNNNPYYFSDVTPSTPGKGNTASASLAFTVSNGEYSDVAYARLEEGEGLPKIGHLTAEAPMLSIPVEGRRYAVANVGSDCESFDLVLRGVSGTYTLSFNGNSSYCHLVDRVAGKEIDMLRQPSYTFSSNGNDADRFMVKLSPEAAESADGNFVYWNGNVWMVEGNGSLQVFDVMGRQVMSFESVNTNIEIQNSQFPGTGVYVLRMGGKSQKIVVK